MKYIVLLFLMSLPAWANENLYLLRASCVNDAGTGALYDEWAWSHYTWTSRLEEGPKIGSGCVETTGWVCESNEKMTVYYQTWKNSGCVVCTESYWAAPVIQVSNDDLHLMSPAYDHSGPDCTFSKSQWNPK